MMRTEDKTRMTEGSISRKIILFAIPLFLGNLFQQLYNTADSLIVGNYLGSNALAAVSSSGNLIFLMVGFINGIAMGAGVVIARYYGAKDKENLEKSIHTTVALKTVRKTMNYDLDIEVVEVAVGQVGDVIVYDKQLNGFKLKFEGSAKSVKVKYKVRGGMYA